MRKPQQVIPKSDEVLYLPLGGAGQIGMNMYLYGHDGDWIMVDCGMSFAHEGIPGIEIIIPDAGFAMDHKENLKGIVITHGHEDHIGAISFLAADLGCPVYATAFTAGLIRHKLEEEGLNREIKVHTIEADQPFSLGSFGLEYIPLTHSIPDNHGLVINTKIGTIFHSGDWKIDANPLLGKPIDMARLRGIGDRGVLAMTCDSTNVFEPGHSGSEAEVRKSLIEIVKQKTGKVAVTLFASNLARVLSIVEAARQSERHVVLVGRSLHRIYDIALNQGLIEPIAELIDEDQAGYFPKSKILYICTGCQGERRSAMTRIAEGMHKAVKLGPGDTVVYSSREIPGNELQIQAVQNGLARKGVELVTAHNAFTHVSGHPYRDELSLMYQAIRPQLAIPMHGEFRHLTEHVALAKSLQVPRAMVVENGNILRITKQGEEIIDEVECGAFGLDGEQWVDIVGNLQKEKTRLVWHGAVNVALALDNKGRIASEIAVNLMAVAEDDAAEQLQQAVCDAVESCIESMSRGERLRQDAVREKLRREVRRVVQDFGGKKPAVEISVLYV